MKPFLTPRLATLVLMLALAGTSLSAAQLSLESLTATPAQVPQLTAMRDSFKAHIVAEAAGKKAAPARTSAAASSGYDPLTRPKAQDGRSEARKLQDYRAELDRKISNIK